MSMSELSVFILSHGRPDNIKTISTLKKHGYTGPIHLIIDDQDDRADEYFALDYPVHQFCKADLAKQTDCGDNLGRMATITHARNACYEIAKELEIDNFIQLDDDYTRFEWRFYEFAPTPDLLNSSARLTKMSIPTSRSANEEFYFFKFLGLIYANARLKVKRVE